MRYSNGSRGRPGRSGGVRLLSACMILVAIYSVSLLGGESQPVSANDASGAALGIVLLGLGLWKVVSALPLSATRIPRASLPLRGQRRTSYPVMDPETSDGASQSRETWPSTSSAVRLEGANALSSVWACAGGTRSEANTPARNRAAVTARDRGSGAILVGRITTRLRHCSTKIGGRVKVCASPQWKVDRVAEIAATRAAATAVSTPSRIGIPSLPVRVIAPLA